MEVVVHGGGCFGIKVRAETAALTMLFAPTVAACCCVFTLHMLRTYLGFSHLCDVIFGYTESLQSALQVEVII